MSTADSTLLQQAVAGLRLHDIVLYESHFVHGEPFPEAEELAAVQQHKRGVSYRVTAFGSEEAAGKRLQVVVSLGERVVDDDSKDEPTIYFGVEAEYMVIYELVTDVSDEALHAFSNLNAVHNVWPFWRQHVFDLIGKARLPPLQIPLFSGGADG
ncbi:protein-export chaperone SecB [Thioalkalivibrio nitratireducens]|uniref:protein-export chaperone SecB n=1 Tax=Thioalkalivibrio nitratireducens TaxID=186931 RepID=UPI0012EE866F|nr:protein-export chaperone SecB [Thioalkalivibrio nitratireducens]